MSGKKKILVVDDQYGIRTLLALVLEKYNIKEAANGQQAIELARSWEPHLIIIDMKMPILNGLDTISSLKEMKLKSKILLMTAYEDDLEFDNTYIAGFISKPFDLDKLILLVDDILYKNPDA